MGGTGDVDVVGIHHRFAHVQRIQQRELFAVRQNEFGQTQHHPLALDRRHARPRAFVESAARTAYSQFHFHFTTRGDTGKQLIRRRVDRIECCARRRSHLPAIDQGFVREGLPGSSLLPIVEVEHATLPLRPPGWSGLLSEVVEIVRQPCEEENY
ncbi:hypothetical protein D3C84_494310 [compost metagenome]